MAFKIEKNVALPPNGGKFSRTKYPLALMLVGDSFLITKGILAGHTPEIIQARSASHWYGKRHNQKFSIRRTEDGYRCWRIA